MPGRITDTLPADRPEVLLKVHRLLLCEAQKLSQDTRHRLQELHQRFHFPSNVLGALQDAGIELHGKADGPPPVR